MASGVAGGVDTGNAGLNEALGNLAANIAAGWLGAVVGGGSGAAMAANVDRSNRQLHPNERQGAKDKARGFAAFYADKTGKTISVEQAENILQVVATPPA